MRVGVSRLVEVLTLFDVMERTDGARAPYSDSLYAFLNRSASPEAEKIRDLLEGWFSHYPAHLRPGLRSRIIAGEFDSVFPELLLHEVVERLGSTAVAHPGEAGRLPDFRVDRDGILSCFLEAAVATDVSGEEVLRRRLLNRFFDGVNQLKPNGFFVDIERLVLLSGRQPSAKAVRKFLREKLDRLDPDRPIYDSRDGRLRYSDDDVEIDFRPVALRPERRGDASLRILGGPPSKSRWGGTAPPLRAKLRDKAGRYGRLPGPYVVAINATSEWGTRREDIIAAVYGESWTLTPAQIEARRSPPEAGILTNAYSRVSAVLVTTAAPWHLRGEAVLLHNPSAEWPYSGELCAFTECRLEGDSIGWKVGCSLADVLGVPPGGA